VIDNPWRRPSDNLDSQGSPLPTSTTLTTSTHHVNSVSREIAFVAVHVYSFFIDILTRIHLYVFRTVESDFSRQFHYGVMPFALNTKHGGSTSRQQYLNVYDALHHCHHKRNNNIAIPTCTLPNSNHKPLFEQHASGKRN
jgi:hypothetical protein